MGRAGGPNWVLVSKPDFFVAARAQLWRRPSCDPGIGNICLSADATAVRSDGELRALRVDVDPRSIALPEVALRYGPGGMEIWRARVRHCGSVGRLGDACLRYRDL